MQNKKSIIETVIMLGLVFIGFSTLSAQPGANLIMNGDFASGLDNWDFELPGALSEATADASTGELFVDIISDNGVNWRIRLFQKGITLEEGKEYAMSFDAKAASARTIIAKVQKDQAPTTSSLHEMVAITDSMQNYSLTWTNEVETATYKAGFFLGADTFDVWIDNVVLVENPAVNYTLSTSATNGTIRLDPDGGIYDEGTVVTVTAIPDSGYAFSGWSGDISDTTIVASITMDEDKSITATFTAIDTHVDGAAQLPQTTELQQNYPNPFNPETSIPYQLSQPTHVEIQIFNSFGQKVSTLVDKEQPAGYYSAKWRGNNDYGRQVASGLYIYRLETNASIQMRKFMLLR